METLLHRAILCNSPELTNLLLELLKEKEMNIHTLFKETTYLDINPKVWTDEEKKIATE
tara:strand:- start:328 stop:504 length:177 start_codon:yes stop_codon:yes gene_type:complete